MKRSMILKPDYPQSNDKGDKEPHKYNSLYAGVTWMMVHDAALRVYRFQVLCNPSPSHDQAAEGFLIVLAGTIHI